jgi:hypothetical protein
MTKHTRREVKWLTPLVLGRFHALIMENNLPGFEALLEAYPDIPAETKRELIEEFKRIAAEQMRRRWRSSK